MRTRVFQTTPNHPHFPSTGKTTTNALPVFVGEDLAAGSGFTATHEIQPSFFVYCTEWGEISTADHLPAHCIELASAKNAAMKDHLKRIIKRTAKIQPSGRRYVPGSTDCSGDARDHTFALYAAKLHQETRSCPV